MASNNSFDRQRALSLFEDATQFLRECVARPVQSSSTVMPCPLSNQAGGERIQPAISEQNPGTEGNNSSTLSTTPTTRQERAMDNFRSLFAPYRATVPSSKNSVLQFAIPPPSKRKKGNHNFCFKRETWTHDFFCLANKDQATAPSRALKLQLQRAGLGRRRICFHGKANASDVKAKLEEIYPKLSRGGGFDILRSGSNCGDLMLLSPPRHGYSVPFLRDVAGLGQAIAYVRPIQTNLSTELIETEEMEAHQVCIPTLLIVTYCIFTSCT